MKLATKIGLLFALTGALIFNVKNLNAQNPNVIFFVVDDMGWKDVQFNGSPLYETPQIDQLRNEGMFMRNSYVAHPRCQPSRWSFASGQYPARVGYPGNFSDSLRRTYVSVAESFKENDYITGFFGKWHHAGDLVTDHGFDVNVGGNNTDGGAASHFFPFGLNNGLETGVNGEFLSDRLTDEALTFINNHRDTTFFAMVSHFAVHTPIECKPADSTYFQTKVDGMTFSGPATVSETNGLAQTKAHQDNAVYAGLVRSIDESLGRIRDSLTAWGLDSNTVIVFTSDHGGLSTTGINNNRQLATSNLPLRAGKGHVYEGGIRVPTIVTWPGQVTANSTSLARVTGTDFYPTMLDLAGLPVYPDRHLDGESFKWAVMENSNPNPDRAMYWHNIKSRLNSTGDTNSSAVVQGNYKLIEFLESGTLELYDLDADEEEQNNLASMFPEIADSLRTMLYNWRCSIGAQDSPTPVGACGDFVEGTFEFCLSGWTASNDHNGTYLGPIGITDSIAYEGSHSISADNLVLHNWKHRIDSDCRFDLVGGQLYRINFHALHESAGGEIRFTLQDSANLALDNTVFAIDSTDWKEFSYDYTPATDQPNCRLRISFRKLGKHNLDNIIFTTNDCNGDFGGSAFIDSCGSCVGGNTMNTACTQDCELVWGGSAYSDSCGTCISTGNGNVPCTQDCNMEWGGTAYTDSCSVCVGGSTMLEPCTQDCNMEWGGTAYLDSCSVCVGGSTSMEPCVQDCNLDWGGTSVVDSCGNCTGGNTGMSGIFNADSCNVGIYEKISFENYVQVYPNPSVNEFNVVKMNSSSFNVAVYNSIGKQIYSGELSTRMSIGESWKSGVYHMVIQVNDIRFTKTLVKSE